MPSCSWAWGEQVSCLHLLISSRNKDSSMDWRIGEEEQGYTRVLVFFQIQNYKNFSILILLYWGKIYFRALPKFLFFLFFRKFFIFWGDFILRTLPPKSFHSHAFTLYRFIPLNHSQHSKLSDNSHNYLYAKSCIHIHLPYFTLSVKFYQFQNRIEQLFFYHILPVNLW